MSTLLSKMTAMARSSTSTVWDDKIMFEPRSSMEESGMIVEGDKLNHERFWGRMEKVSKGCSRLVERVSC